MRASQKSNFSLSRTKEIEFQKCARAAATKKTNREKKKREGSRKAQKCERERAPLRRRRRTRSGGRKILLWLVNYLPCFLKKCGEIFPEKRPSFWKAR